MTGAPDDPRGRTARPATRPSAWFARPLNAGPVAGGLRKRGVPAGGAPAAGAPSGGVLADGAPAGGASAAGASAGGALVDGAPSGGALAGGAFAGGASAGGAHRGPARRPDARPDALDGLRRRGAGILLQRDAAGAAALARDAERRCLDLARSWLASGDPAAAVRALETGRGLALLAATRYRDVPATLDAARRRDLALRWRMSAPGREPAALRQEILDVMCGGRAEPPDPPALPEIGDVLGALDADALVYLVPGAPPTPGWAVMIAAGGGRPSCIALPGLHDAGAPAADGLEMLGGWAWRVAMGPLVERFLPSLPPPSGRPHRVVLVAMGGLSRVPWQAAHHNGRYAVQAAAFSHALSAGMLCGSAAAAPVPVAPVGLVVGDPATAGPALPGARAEACAVHRVFYPGARYVGRRADGSPARSGPGTAAEVRDWLTDTRPAAGAVLHLACHGAPAHLALAAPAPGAGDGRLTAGEVGAALAGAPDRAIALVVLAACGAGHDEAAGLGTAFLAGGVRSVLSARWHVPDRAASLLLFMFHHFLMAERRPAWDALHRAQLWMLDAGRTPPPRMPGRLLRHLSETDPARAVAWSGYVHSGQ
ncbi:CHAT domain-containing protein [Dactylosporangium sp. NPDC005555]|uniref:CHAT domain-containing protein n=1 Tax=Dactylosporangium sp. NPDC005555 TaxID=3154889 RepID=UPI0033ACF13D